MRAALIWLISTIVLLASFLLFVALGWPGDPDSCTTESPNTCYCEAYDLAEVEANAPGVRQPGNTWFNLYSIFSSAILVAFLRKDRLTFQGRTAPNLMRSDSWIPDIYLFAVLFLGLGSMWFHASLTSWGGLFDGLSMYIYAAFLVFYTAIRLCGRQIIFWIGYPTFVIMMTILHALKVPSFALIIILVVCYLLLEVLIWIERREFALGEPAPILLWIFAAVSIIAATIFWVLSQTGKRLCDPDTWAQPHGLLWHPLAGVMAVLLYFYWREEEPR
jgi:hypothetical protein